MEVTTTLGKVTTLSVTGYIDAETFPQLISEAGKVLEAGRANLVLDLSGVDYISSSGLIALQTISGRAATQGGKAVVCYVGKQVAQVLKISGFVQRLTILADVEAAVASS